MKTGIMMFLFLLSTIPAYAQVTIGASPDGKPVVISAGKKVWPPQGPGCQDMVRCCDSAAKVESSVSLMCQLTISTPPVDCVKGLKTVKQYLSERNLVAPSECGK